MNLLAQIEVAKKFADLAEGKSDRWLLIIGVAMLMSITVMSAIWAGKWLVKRFEMLSDKHEASMDSHAAAIRSLCEEAHKVNRDLAVAMDRNTCALEEGSEERRKTRETLDLLRGRLQQQQQRPR